MQRERPQATDPEMHCLVHLASGGLSCDGGLTDVVPVLTCWQYCMLLQRKHLTSQLICNALCVTAG